MMTEQINIEQINNRLNSLEIQFNNLSAKVQYIGLKVDTINEELQTNFVYKKEQNNG